MTTRGQASGPADPELVALTRRLLVAGCPADVEAALNEIKPDLDHFRRLLTYLDRQNAPEVALEACRAVFNMQLYKDANPSLIAQLWTKVMRMHSRRRGGGSAALLIYDELVAAGVSPDQVTFNTALSAAGAAGQWARVLSIRGDMQRAGVPADGFTYSSLLSACQSTGNWNQAMEWLEEMEAAGEN